DPDNGARLAERPLHLITAFSKDGRFVATSGDDRTTWVWNAANGEAVAGPFLHEAGPERGTFSSEGDRVCWIDRDGEVSVWSVSSGVEGPAVRLELTSTATWSPDGTRIITTFSNTAQVRSSAGEPIGSPLQHQGRITAATFSPDGKLTLTASE